jgi:hypothetical protein
MLLLAVFLEDFFFVNFISPLSFSWDFHVPAAVSVIPSCTRWKISRSVPGKILRYSTNHQAAFKLTIKLTNLGQREHTTRYLFIRKLFLPVSGDIQPRVLLCFGARVPVCFLGFYISIYDF